MKWSFLPAFFFALPVLAQTPAATDSHIKLTARAERADALYHQHEPVIFVLKLERDGKPVPSAEVDWTMVKDGLPLDQKGRATIKDGEAKVTGKLDEPGFLQVRASYREQPKAAPVTAAGGAGIDPTEIKPSMPVPEDFDAFWDAQKKKLAAIPLNPHLEEVKSPSKTVAAWDIKADSVRSQISGYLAKPVGAAPKSLPIILTVHGAGVRSSALGGPVGWAAQGFVAMDMNAHGIPNGRPDAYYTELANTTLKDYRYVGRDSREECYFLFMYLRLIRALDFLTSQPEWDGKTVIVYGGSQGGAQAFAAAGLDPRVTFFCAAVPAMNDHTGMVVNRIAGWPKLVAVNADHQPDPKGIEAARYFDGMNLATRTHALGAQVTTGFIDTVCPPTSVYAAYNALTIPKHIFNDIEYGHPYSKDAIAAMTKAAHDHAEARRVVPWKAK